MAWNDTVMQYVTKIVPEDIVIEDGTILFYLYYKIIPITIIIFLIAPLILIIIKILKLALRIGE